MNSTYKMWFRRPLPWALALAGALFPGVAGAVIQMQSVNLPAVIGHGQTVAVTLSYQATGSGPTDTITVPVPANLQVGAPATAGCVTAGAPGSETLTCTVNTPALGDNGSVQVNLSGRTVLSGLNITATSGNTVSQSYSVIEAGDLRIQKAASLATVVNGKAFTFTLTPSVAAGGDPVASTAVVRITDTLPGSTAQYKLTAISAAGYSCNTVAAAQAARSLVCNFTGNGAAAMGPIVLTGNTTLPGTGNLTNNVSIATVDSKYIDLNVNNNTDQASVAVSPGTDPEPLGSFPASALTSSAQNFTLTYRNNGPQSTTGAVVRVAVPIAFTPGAPPAGCSDTATVGTINGVSGDIIACTTGTVASAGTQAFVIPLTTPATATSGNFGIEVVTSGAPPLLPDGAEDYAPANNLKLVPYSVIVPTADLTVTKSKSTGPIAAGGNITNTIRVTNNSIATATYSAAGGAMPLRVVDTMSMNEVYVSASAAWTCSAFDDTPAAGQRRVVCELSAGGTLAPSGFVDLTLTTQVLSSIAAPTSLTNTACTGLTALTQLGLTGADGPQPADTNTGNDCAPPTTVIGTPIGAGGAPVSVSIVKESSVDNTAWVDATTPAGLPRLVAGADTLYWRWTIQNTSATDTIPTLHVGDTLPAIANVTKTAPVPSAKTPAITPVTTVSTGSATGSCPALAIGASVLACDFTNVAPNTTIVVTIPVSRPLLSSANPFTNTATLSSPNAILTGTLSDAAALYIDGRSDWVVTAVSVNPGTPKVGQDITFTAVAANYGPDVNSQAVKITSHLDPAKYELSSASAVGMTCAINNPAAGDVTCTENAVSADPYVTRTVNFGARVLKPGALPPSGNVYTGETVSASVAMNAADCEWRVESSTAPVSTSTACNDAAATSNNSKTTSFNVTVPVIDLVQRKLQVYPGAQTAFGFGDALGYRLRIQNGGPSRAETVRVVDRISLPTGVTVASIAVSSINGVAADTGYTLDASKTGVSCTVTAGAVVVPTPDSTAPGAPGDVVCVLDPVSANSFLGVNKEVNFLLSFTLSNSLTSKYIAGNRAAACADETQSYEPSGRCSFETGGANNAGNNIAVVSDVVYPKTDLAITKTRVTANPADVGQPVRYELAVQNLGANGTSKIRVTDQLPANFEWVTGSAKVDATTTLDTTPTAVASGAGAGSVSAVSCSANPATLSVVGGTQLITCDLSGNFPASATASYTLSLWARAKPGYFTGPYLSNRTNTATVYPGKDGAGADLSLDTNAANNSATAQTQITKASLAGRVFLDLNNNGDQNGSTVLTDQGLGGVTLTLTGTDRWGNSVSRTTSTDNAALGAGSTRGDYLFDNLAASDASGYTVTQTQPAAFGNGAAQANTARSVRNASSTGVSGPYAVSNTSGTSVIAGLRLDVGAVGVQFDFPENQKPTLSGFVFLDLNSDGNKGAGEAGIDGVGVRLIGCRAGPNGVIDTASAVAAGPVACAADDVAVDLSTSTATDATLGAGYYRFVLDEPGRYSVLQQSTQPAVSAVTTLRGKTTAGSVDKISSAVGSNDAGTRGTANATAANAGAALGVQQEATAVVATSQIRDIVITDSAGQAVNNNFGEVLPASVSGTVYTEKGAPNSNFASGVDWPLPNAVLTLTGTDDLGQAVSTGFATGWNGTYAFNGLRPGVYQIAKTNPAGGIVDELGGAYPGRDEASVTRGTRVNDDLVNAVTLNSGTKVAATNFAVTNGPAPDAIISAYVYVDRNRNHSVDSDERKRLQGVSIRLVQGTDCASGTRIDTAQTDVVGLVYFHGVVGQSYLLCEEQPAGYGNGNADGVPASNSIAITNLAQTGSFDHSFGEWVGSIAGSVYEDMGSGAGQTHNGLRDAGEAGIGKVPLTLTGRDIDGVAVALRATTDADGRYVFDDLVAPDAAGYTVTEGALPATAGSYTDGKDSAGSASVAAGDAVAVNDQISGIRIAAGERAGDYNFGELKAASISGTVFFDQNGNGLQDPGESGIAGVGLSLSGTDLNGASVNLGVATDANGRYRFDGLRPSSPTGYAVTEQVEQPLAPGSALRTANGITTAGSVEGVGVGVATPVSQLPSAVTAIVLPANAQSVQNNFAEVLVLGPDLVVTKSADKTVFTENNDATYTVRVKNVGTAPTSGSYTVLDQLSASGTPARWALTSAGGTGWTCSIGADQQQLSCSSAQVLAPGEESSASIRIGVHIGAGAVSAGPLRNVVSVSGGGEPPEKQPQAEEKRNPPGCTANPLFNVCVVSTPLQVSVGLDGHVWIDGSRKQVLDGSDKLLPQWIVEVYDAGGSGQNFGALVRSDKPSFSTTTDAQGHYQLCGLEPGHEYRVLFRDPASRIAFPGVVTNESGRATGPDYWSQVKTIDGIEVLQVRPPAAPSGASSSACNVTAVEQSLPMDPNGVVYDSQTRAPVSGATVALVPEGSCPGYDPRKYVINYETYGQDAAGNPTMLTGADGFYKFLLSGDPAAPKSCQFKLVLTSPAGYKPAPSALIAPKAPLATPPAPGIYNVQTQKTAPSGNQDTRYHLALSLGLNHQEVFNNHIPLDPNVPGSLVLSKTGDKRVAQVGDTVLYTLTVSQTAGDPTAQVRVRDRLPLGFTLVPGTVRVNGLAAPDPVGAPGAAVLSFQLGAIRTGQRLVLNYRLRVGVGAQLGDGVNMAQAAVCSSNAVCGPDGPPTRYRVEVGGGVFADSACVLGKVFVDCNHNHVQDAEELGIPGVRLYFETGAFLVSDSEGKFSQCGLTPRSHVLKVDPLTLPQGARLTTSSNRNLGDANSLFVDAKGGMLQRADFVEGSCSNTVLEQVKARRAQGEVRSVETEGNGRLRLQSKSADAPRQATDGANQPWVQPRALVPERSGADSMGAEHAR